MSILTEIFGLKKAPRPKTTIGRRGAIEMGKTMDDIAFMCEKCAKAANDGDGKAFMKLFNEIDDRLEYVGDMVRGHGPDEFK